MAEEASAALARHDLEAKIVKHCWEDEEFRKEFTADPQGTFVKYLNIPAGSLPKIVVHEESPGSWHIVLREKPADAAELSEVELEGVAGGISTPVTLIGSIIGPIALLNVATVSTMVVPW
jgi:hypothetical protein